MHPLNERRCEEQVTADYDAGGIVVLEVRCDGFDIRGRSG